MDGGPEGVWISADKAKRRNKAPLLAVGKMPYYNYKWM